MKRRGKALGMALLFIMMTVFSVVSDAAMVKADELLIKLHYHRADDNYDGWDVWMWGEGADGAAYELAEEDGDYVATMDLLCVQQTGPRMLMKTSSLIFLRWYPALWIFMQSLV